MSSPDNPDKPVTAPSVATATYSMSGEWSGVRFGPNYWISAEKLLGGSGPIARGNLLSWAMPHMDWGGDPHAKTLDEVCETSKEDAEAETGLVWPTPERTQLGSVYSDAALAVHVESTAAPLREEIEGLKRERSGLREHIRLYVDGTGRDTLKKQRDHLASAVDSLKRISQDEHLKVCLGTMEQNAALRLLVDDLETQIKYALVPLVWKVRADGLAKALEEANALSRQGRPVAAEQALARALATYREESDPRP